MDEGSSSVMIGNEKDGETLSSWSGLLLNKKAASSTNQHPSIAYTTQQDKWSFSGVKEEVVRG